MPQQIDVPGYGVVEFPDGMSDEQISAAIKKNMMVPKKGVAAQTWDMLKQSSGAPIAGGPMAMIARGGMEQVNKATDKLAYGAGGKVTDVLAGKVEPEIAAGAGYLANLGTQLGISYGMGKAGAALGRGTMEDAARRTMGAAVKPLAKDWETGKAARAIDTLLKENVSPTEAGISKLRGEIANLNSEIDDAIKGSTAMVNKAEVGKRLKDALDKFTKQVNPKSDMATIRNAWLEFRGHPLLAGKTEFPVQLAQELKKGTYKALDSKAYGEVGSSAQEAQKALARGLKEEIAKAVPAVGPLNARESELINAARVAQRRVMMSQNNNLLGLGPIAPNTGSMLAFLADRSPAAASMLARTMYQNAGVIPGGAAAAASMPMLANMGVNEQPPALMWLNPYMSLLRSPALANE